MRWSIPMLLVAGVIAAAAAHKATKQDQEQFQGSWVTVSGEHDGKEIPKEALEQMKLVIKGNHYTFTTPKGTTEKGTFKLDPGKTPKHVDITPSGGPNKGQTVHGIYELEDGKHKSCFAPAGQERPSDFTCKEGSGRSLYVLERAKE